MSNAVVGTVDADGVQEDPCSPGVRTFSLPVQLALGDHVASDVVGGHRRSTNIAPIAVRVGGVAARQIFVEHDDHTFTGTVEQNLLLADPGLGEQGVWRLLRLMRLDVDGIGPSHRGGTGGRALSGGEHRRSAIAREAAARPGVLLLDEPVESVDRGTTRDVLGNLRQLLSHTTQVVAVHDRLLPDLPRGFGLTLSLDDDVAWREHSRFCRQTRWR